MKVALLSVALVSGLCSSAIAFAQSSQTLSAGYAQTRVSEVGESANMSGGNIKYHWESDTGWGVIGSVAYTTHSDSGLNLKLLAVNAGPSWRFNDYLSVYALLGITHGRSEYSSSYTTAGRTESVEYTGSSTAFSYGAGVQFNPVYNFAIDASYVYSNLPDSNLAVHAGTWMLGVGYRF